MAGIFTRKALMDVLNDADMTPEQRADQIYSLYGRAIDDGFVTKNASTAAINAAVEQAKTEWEKGITPPDPKESEEYKALQARGEN